MNRAKSQVRTIEITRAVRSTRLGGLSIKKKQPIGFLDGDLVAVSDKISEVLDQVLAKLDLDGVDVITIYYGADTKSDEAEQLSATIREQHSNLQVEVVRGGQPHYDYIISVE